MIVVVKRAVLLLLLAAVCANIAADSDICELTTKRLDTKDLHGIFGEWVLVWAVSNSPVGQALMPRINSSHVELKLAGNDTIVLTERNLYIDDKCATYHINISMPTDDDHHVLPIDSIIFEQDGEAGVFNDTMTVVFYKSCPDCLQLGYNSTALGGFMLSYRREGLHRDVEQVKAVEADHKKMAECLHFPHDSPYEYDGVSDFCHKKSAPAADAEES